MDSHQVEGLQGCAVAAASHLPQVNRAAGASRPTAGSFRDVLAIDTPGQLLSFASTSWVSAMSTKAAGHLRAGSERQSHKSRVPVSRRSCVPAIDPLLSYARSSSMTTRCRKLKLEVDGKSLLLKAPARRQRPDSGSTPSRHCDQAGSVQSSTNGHAAVRSAAPRTSSRRLG